MSSFFEKHKRKSVWTLLLLLFRRGRFVAALLLLVVMLGSTVFSSGGPVWASRWARRAAIGMGLGRFLDSPALALLHLDNLLRSLQSEEHSNALYHAQAAAYYNPKKNSVDMVGGGRALLASSLRNSGMYGFRGANTVEGVLRPDEASKMREGVPLNEQELQNGLLKSAFAGIFAGGLAQNGARSRLEAMILARDEGSPGGGAGGRRPVSAIDPLDNAIANMSGGSGNFSTVVGGHGKMSTYDQSNRRTKVGNAMGIVNIYNPTNIQRLYITKMFGCMANPTTPNCSGAASSSGSSKEFASYAMDISYSQDSANPVGGLGILNATDMGETVDVPPDTGALGTQTAQANQQNTDFQTCHNALAGDPSGGALTQYGGQCQKFFNIQCNSCCSCGWQDLGCCWDQMMGHRDCSGGGPCDQVQQQLNSLSNTINNIYPPSVLAACNNIGQPIGGAAAGAPVTQCN